jgi:hypothetical protein
MNTADSRFGHRFLMALEAAPESRHIAREIQAHPRPVFPALAWWRPLVRRLTLAACRAYGSAHPLDMDMFNSRLLCYTIRIEGQRPRQMWRDRRRKYRFRWFPPAFAS